MLAYGIDPRTGIFDVSALPEHQLIERVPPHWKNTDSWPFLAMVRQETPTTPPKLWHDLESMTLWVPLYVVLHRFAPTKPTTTNSPTTPTSTAAPTVDTVDYNAVRALFIAHWFYHDGWFRNPEGGMYCRTSGHISGATRKLAWLEEGQYRAFYRDVFVDESHGSAGDNTGGEDDSDEVDNDTESNENDGEKLRKKHPAAYFFTCLCNAWANVYDDGVGGVPEIRGLRRSFMVYFLDRAAVACGVGDHEPILTFCREVLEGWDKSGDEDEDEDEDEYGGKGKDRDGGEGKDANQGDTRDD